MDHAPAKTPAAQNSPRPGNGRACAECLAPFDSIQPGQLFCCPEHRTTFQDRLRIRGRQLTPLEMADRATRGGSRGDKKTGIAARRAAQRLKDRWTREDSAAGRMAKHYDLAI